MDAEQQIVVAASCGRRDEAVSLLLRTYGPEILAYLVGVHRSDEDGTEVFALFAEAVWKSIDAFRQDSSVRTWAYAVARRTSLRYRRDQRRRERRFKAFDDHPHLAEVEAKVRTETLTFLRTEKRSKLAELRASLTPAERELLTLRIDRKLSWNDLVLVLARDGAALPADELRRRAARLRKQFQTLKDRLRAAATQAGLLVDAEEV